MTDTTRLEVSQVIACLVRAVRCGDARMAQELLHRFSTLAEFEDLMELRAALEADLCRVRTGPRWGDLGPQASFVPARVAAEGRLTLMTAARPAMDTDGEAVPPPAIRGVSFGRSRTWPAS
ncbi:hypothetical protein [Streptacidiphilus rugosus]|uniref:hypothetical protein n=1 Tax=Streptacidiphilus rugosus TaxID=405783 RepID=UPI00056CE16A|nr:hypothetical protein [Streptacidiphilus rugosus]